MDEYEVTTFRFNPGLLLFRGIKYSEKPKFLHDIIYPPKDQAKINRASEKGEQMFYASTVKKAVVYELNIKSGDRLIISTWRTNNILLFNNVGYTKANLENLGANKVTPFNDEGENEVNKLIADYLALSFCQNISEEDEHLYKLTIAIARIHLHDVNDNRFAGLYYPTVRLNGDEENFAIDKNVVDHGLLDFEGIQFIEIIDRIYNRYKYSILDIAEDITDYNINWKNLSNHWTVYDDSEDLYFIEEGGNIFAYNQDGDKILSD